MGKLYINNQLIAKMINLIILFSTVNLCLKFLIIVITLYVVISS